MSTTETLIENVSGSDTFSSWFKIRGHGINKFTAHLSGTWVGTVTFQMSKPDAADPVDLDTFTGKDGKTGDLSGSWDIRFGFKAGQYTSGTLALKISQ